MDHTSRVSSSLLGFCLICLLGGTFAAAPCTAEGMPKDFVYLRDVDPTILQDMRYASSNNFVGRTVPGYEAPECVLVSEAAEALKAAQAELKEKQLSLKVYDCYRPGRAVKAFVAWAKLPDDPKAKSTYYPGLPKSALFPDYIALVSGHSRAATADLTAAPAIHRPSQRPHRRAPPRPVRARRVSAL